MRTDSRKRGGHQLNINLGNWYKNQKKKNDIGLDISTYAGRLRCLESLLIDPVDEDIWIRNLELDWDHPDPADRTIVATAMVREADLITKDTAIRRFYERAVW